uniref:Uncharacterized protein n=1 Tax=Glossina palpalis gambiensis TaxID=67801 RepID=A0A1B0AZ40_9MUSC
MDTRSFSQLSFLKLVDWKCELKCILLSTRNRHKIALFYQNCKQLSMKRSKRRRMCQKRRKKQRLKKIKTGKKSNNRTDRRNYSEISIFGDSQVIETNSYSQGLRSWWETYCTAIAYYQEQQRRWSYQQHNVEDYQTSSEGENSDEQSDEDEDIRASFTDEIDLEYLKFLEITNKHREELRLSKEKEKYINQ